MAEQKKNTSDFDQDTAQQLVIDITKLREEGRPLWMSPLGIDHPAIVAAGDGGDVWQDRITPEWPRYGGEELLGDVEAEVNNQQQFQQLDQEKFSQGDFPPKSDLTSTVEEAFKYVHSDKFSNP